jgi:Icc-related predicted phosphoesterase
VRCFFVSDLHGRTDRYEKLFAVIRTEHPAAVFIGGDILPTGSLVRAALDPAPDDFIRHYLAPAFLGLRKELRPAAPEIFLILGNDDVRIEEESVLDAETRGCWQYAHGRRLSLGPHAVYGCAFVPPTPFLLKDWERYDVSRYVDPGCVSPEEGYRSVAVPPDDVKWSTIQKELARLSGDDDLSEAIFLFHSPPHETPLDRAALDGQTVEGVPLDPHVGSIAIRRFLEERGPRVSLHGHIHESTRLTGTWRAEVGRTHAFTAAHDGPELALVRFDPRRPEEASRELL